MTGLIRFAACVLWATAIIHLTAALLRLRRTRRLDRAIDEALRLVETPVEDRPEWGQR